MADDLSKHSVRTLVGEEEWRARVDLAALYRITALLGWDDLAFTHISIRTPGPEAHFLLNPYGSFFDEITASSLVKVDVDGEIVGPVRSPVNRAGFVIHSAVHASREDAHCVIHLHTRDGGAVSCQKEGLLPISQRALIVLGSLAYHSYEGVALNLDERARLVRDLGDKRAMILRNHGTLSVGATAAEAFLNIYLLERACETQVSALSAGRSGVLVAPEAAQAENMRMAGKTPSAAAIVWPGVLRKLARQSPGYDS